MARTEPETREMEDSFERLMRRFDRFERAAYERHMEVIEVLADRLTLEMLEPVVRIKVSDVVQL